MINTTTALITGSAIRVGAEIAKHLAGQGYAIGLHCHSSRKEAEALAEEIRGRGAACAVVVADLSDEHAAKTIFSGLSDLPPVELLIHNASRFEKDSLETLSRHEFSSHMQINLETPLQLTKLFAESLPKNRFGNVICLLDGMNGWSLSSHFLSYSLSRKAMEAAIELLACDLAPHIRINGIAMGATLPGKKDSPHILEKLKAMTPLKQLSSPEDVCRAIDFLLAANGSTGQILDLSGGMNLRRTHRSE